jgi:hypothetical protein
MLDNHPRDVPLDSPSPFSAGILDTIIRNVLTDRQTPPGRAELKWLENQLNHTLTSCLRVGRAKRSGFNSLSARHGDLPSHAVRYHRRRAYRFRP